MGNGEVDISVVYHRPYTWCQVNAEFIARDSYVSPRPQSGEGITQGSSPKPKEFQ